MGVSSSLKQSVIDNRDFDFGLNQSNIFETAHWLDCGGRRGGVNCVVCPGFERSRLARHAVDTWGPRGLGVSRAGWVLGWSWRCNIQIPNMHV